MGKEIMVEIPDRGKLRKGLSFGYVDVPSKITDKDRPFLNKLTQDSLDLQLKIRKKIDIRRENYTIATEKGNIPIRVFIPEGDGPFPMVLYYHGGGFAIRDIECYDYIASYIAENSHSVVFLPGYYLAPEYRYPVQLEQSLKALVWAEEQADKFHINRNQVVVFGDSAGGNLASAVIIACKERGIKIPDMQLLAYPSIDMRFGTGRESEKIYATGYNLDYKHMTAYSLAYVEREEQLNDPHVSPILYENLSFMPYTCILSAECDILIDQAMEYIKKLRDSGVRTEYKIYKGVPHDFLFFDYPESYDAYDTLCHAIVKQFGMHVR